MAVIAPINVMAVPMTLHAPPTVIVVTQNIICPIGTPPDPNASTGTHGYAHVG